MTDNAWDKLHTHDKERTVITMRERGGGFVSALAEAWQRADDHNRFRLETAFPDMVERYGPTSCLHIPKGVWP